MTATIDGSAATALTVPQLQRALRAVRFVPAAVAKAAISGREAVAIVAGAQPSVGTSTVALAVAEAAAARAETTVLLAEYAATPALSVATDANLGDCGDGWQLGRRGRIVIASRSATPGEFGRLVVEAERVVLDVGAKLDAVPPDGPVILVCWPTVPSLRRAEQALASLPGQVAIASIGSNRWPGVVRTSAGPRIAALRRSGRVVSIAVDPRLALTGPTSAPLPRSLLAAGHLLLRLLGSRDGDES